MNASRFHVLLMAFGAASAFAQEANNPSPAGTTNHVANAAIRANQPVTNDTTSAVAVTPPRDWVTEWQVVPTLVAGLFTLGGVAFGLGWGAWRENRKDKERIRRTVKQIQEELRANLQMLPWKRGVLKQIVAKLQANELLPGESVRFLRAFYTEHFAAMCPYLSERERNSLHVIYERLRVVDETMASYESEMRSVMLAASNSAAGPHIIGQFTRFQLGKMKDLLEELTLTEDLMQKHLAGQPDDVFQPQSTGAAGNR